MVQDGTKPLFKLSVTEDGLTAETGTPTKKKPVELVQY